MARVFDIAIFGAAALAAVPIGVPSSADAAECTCRAPGRRIELGGTLCLPTPNGPRLALCVMDLNITSWKILDVPCPVSMTPTPEPPVHATALASAPQTGTSASR